jgi:hypothetical protein
MLSSLHSSGMPAWLDSVSCLTALRVM